jgi:transcriptional regulator of acetoin/glycerol metabolism
LLLSASPRVTPSTQFIAYQPEAIWSARKAFFDEGRETIHQVGDAVLRSWRRCNTLGRSIHDTIEFAPVAPSELRMLADRNRSLLDAARPALTTLARSVAGAGYAVLLSDASGQVVEVDGAISSHSTPLRHAFRRGVDLSEKSIGTSAMSLAISEQQPASVCGPEHFFSEVQMFHCHAAPVFDPQGDIFGAVDVSHDMPGMLRSALWLANRCAQRIERRMFHAQQSFLHLQIDVDEGQATASGGYSQAWISLDPDGPASAAHGSAVRVAIRLSF